MKAVVVSPVAIALVNPGETTYEDIILERQVGDGPFEPVPGAPRWLPPGDVHTFHNAWVPPAERVQEFYRGLCLDSDANRAFEFSFRLDPEDGIQDWQTRPTVYRSAHLKAESH
jgi:hypothetical protein